MYSFTAEMDKYYLKTMQCDLKIGFAQNTVLVIRQYGSI